MRLFVVQWHDSFAGWITAPGEFKKEKEADKFAEEMANKYVVACRTHKLPHGASNEGGVMPRHGAMKFSLTDEIKEARKTK